MPKDLFCKSFVTIQCIQGNKIGVTTLADTCATGYGFIDKEFAKTVCQVLEIELQRLIKPKQIQEFDDRASKPITQAIYPTLTVRAHTENLTSLLITKFGNQNTYHKPTNIRKSIFDLVTHLDIYFYIVFGESRRHFKRQIGIENWDNGGVQ